MSATEIATITSSTATLENGVEVRRYMGGLTKLELASMHAMHGLLAGGMLPTTKVTNEMIASTATTLAKAMLTKLSQEAA